MTKAKSLTLRVLAVDTMLAATAFYGHSELKLWYDAPASKWEEALPLGNGAIGAMLYGNPLDEVYMLNEQTLWSEGPKDAINPKAIDALPRVRDAVDRGDYEGAAAIWKENSQGPYSARYLPMADLKISMAKGDVLYFGRLRRLWC